MQRKLIEFQKLYRDLPTSEVARRLGKTQKAVTQYAYLYGVRKSANYRSAVNRANALAGVERRRNVKKDV